MVLNPMHPREVVRYAVACLEKQAVDLSLALSLFQIPGEAFAGGSTVAKALSDRARMMATGEEPPPIISEEDARLIAEVEEELKAEYPWYGDEQRLDRIWKGYGNTGTVRHMLH